MKIKLSLFIASFFLASIENHAVMIQKIESHVVDYPSVTEKDTEENILPLADLIDMEGMVQPFILETKRIDLSEFPGAFNPSIIRWRGSILMSFRFYHPQTRSTNPFALVWLDENFDPVGTPQTFELPFHNPVLPSKQQDPRLIVISDRLFAVYNNILENVTHRELRRMFITEFFFDGEKFEASEPECLIDFEGRSETRYEKNWIPFEYQGELLLGYSILPHRIFRPLLGKNACETVSTSQTNIKWAWGEPRGGTQALLDGDHYLAFFHSWKDIPTVQSNGKKISHYVMGAYTFEPYPPFNITAMSPGPIVAESFYSPPYHKTWKPLRCVFPSGIILDEKYIWLAYGRQDHEIWIAKLDKQMLLQSLIPVSK